MIGLFEAADVLSFEMQCAQDVQRIREAYNDRLCCGDAFWERKLDSRYATLMVVSNARRVTPIEVHAKNRQSWLIYEDIQGIADGGMLNENQL